jgi:hypothetical protein
VDLKRGIQRQGVSVTHRFDAGPNVIIEERPVASEQRKQLFAQLTPPDHPLEVLPPTVVIWTVQPSSEELDEPAKETLMTGVHSQSHLSIASVAPEVTLAHQNSQEVSNL